MLALLAVSMPGATEDIASRMRLPIADAAMILHGPKGRRINWKYQSGLLPKFQRAAAQGASEQVSSDLRTPGCGRLTAADET